MSEALSLAHYTQSVCDSVRIITVVVVVGEIDGAELHKSAASVIYRTTRRSQSSNQTSCA
jgi:hypothetical protein